MKKQYKSIENNDYIDENNDYIIENKDGIMQNEEDFQETFQNNKSFHNNDDHSSSIEGGKLSWDPLSFPTINEKVQILYFSL